LALSVTVTSSFHLAGRETVELVTATDKTSENILLGAYNLFMEDAGVVAEQ
jgi:hypothetical protein